MKNLYYLIAALVVGSIFALPSIAEADVQTNYWKLLSGSIQPNIASWTLTLPYLPNKNCIGTDANGLLQTGTCGGSGTVTQIDTTFPIQGGPITTSGTLTFGGLSTSSAAVVGNIPYFSGVNTFANIATTSVSCSGSVSCTSFTAIGAAPVTITATGGSSFGQSWEIDSAGQLAPTTTIAVSIPKWLSINDQTFAYGSSTTNTTILGLNAGGNAATTSSSQNVRNTTIGAYAGAIFNGAASSTAIGYKALSLETSSAGNTAVGASALGYTNAGAGNVAVGDSAGGLTTGNRSIFVGLRAGEGVTSGSGNIIIGSNVTLPTLTDSNVLNIGNILWGTGTYSGAPAISSSPVANAKIGVGTSTPFAKLSVHALNGETTPTLFAVSSSTSSTIATLFSVNNIGSTTLASTFGGCSGTQALNTNANGTIVCGTVSSGSGTVTSIANGGGLNFSVSPITTSGTITAQVGTSSVPTQGGLAYWTGIGTPSTLGTVATGTLSTGTTGLTLSGSPTLVNGASTLAGTLAIANGGTNQTFFSTFAPITFDGTRFISTSTEPYYVGAIAATSTASKSYFGTTTPWASLSINPNAAQGSGPAFAIGSSSMTSFLVSGAGNIGIGTSSPFFRLSLDRSLGIASSSIYVSQYNPATSTAQVVDCKDSNTIHVSLGTSATTITLKTMFPGQTCKVIVSNPNSTAGAVTWAGTGQSIYWAGGTTPTQTTTANKRDVWSFIADQMPNNSTTTPAINILGAQTANF